MFIIICGGGKVGISLAKKLATQKNKVILIEKRPEICQRIAREIQNIIVLQGDACEPTALEEARTEEADILVAVTGDDEDNLIICQLGKTYFSVKRTIARVNDSRNEETFSRLGIDVPIDATSVIAQVINQEMSLDDIKTLLKFKQGRLSIVEGKVTKGSPLIDKKIKDLQIPQNCIIVSVLRKDQIIVPHGETIINRDDEILAVISDKDDTQFLQLFSKSKKNEK